MGNVYLLNFIQFHSDAFTARFSPQFKFRFFLKIRKVKASISSDSLQAAQFGTESRWGGGTRFSAPVQSSLRAHTDSYTVRTGS